MADPSLFCIAETNKYEVGHIPDMTLRFWEILSV